MRAILGRLQHFELEVLHCSMTMYCMSEKCLSERACVYERVPGGDVSTESFCSVCMRMTPDLTVH